MSKKAVTGKKKIRSDSDEEDKEVNLPISLPACEY